MFKFGSSLGKNLVCFIALFGFVSLCSANSANERERERERGITLASNADVQRQIEALKQENELLELQQKNEALKRGESSAEIAEQIQAIKAENEALKAKKAQNDKIIKQGFLGFCRGKYSQTGCFIGGELGLGIVDNWFWADLNASDFETQNTTTVRPIINLIFGYQWYYMQSQGIRVKANIGYANYNFDAYSEVNEGRQKSTIKTNAIQYGLEIAWLWDFLRKGKHTLGIDLGTGFEGTSFFGAIDGGEEGDTNLDNFTSFTWITRFGLHYYFNVNHQIGLAYAYKGGYTATNGQKLGNIGIFAISPRNQISLSYAYKF